jgi:hypothetical protein
MPEFTILEVTTTTPEGDFGGQWHTITFRFKGKKRRYRGIPGRSIDQTVEDAYFWACGCVARPPVKGSGDNWDFTEDLATAADFEHIERVPLWDEPPF